MKAAKTPKDPEFVSDGITSAVLDKHPHFKPNQNYHNLAKGEAVEVGTQVGTIIGNPVHLISSIPGLKGKPTRDSGYLFSVKHHLGAITNPQTLKQLGENTQMEELLEYTIDGAATGNVNDFRTGVEQMLLHKISFRLEEERRVVAEEFFGETDDK